jgi:MoaA/NifB/PqqE/SkfB family radical SAM enzyme
MDKRRHDSTKLPYHERRVKAYFDRGLRVPPIHIDMGIAKFCNVKCVFCYGLFQNVKPVFIQKDALLNTIRGAKEIDVKSIAFIGDGEPTCNPHVYEALELGAEIGLDMAISTNGFLVNESSRRHSILASCKWMRFCISAGTQEGYKKIHQKDYFKDVVKNIKDMVLVKKSARYPCEVGMQAVYIPGMMNQDMIEEAKLAVDLGVDYFVIKQCSLPDKGESGMSYFDINEYDSKATDDTLHTCAALSTKDTEIIVKWNIIKQKGARPYQGCPSVPFISEMSGNGDWYPCGHMFGDKPEFASYKFGNVHEKSLVEIYESGHYWEVIKRMRENFDVQNQCKGACRLDKTNEFCWNYMNRPRDTVFLDEQTSQVQGVNFI